MTTTREHFLSATARRRLRTARLVVVRSVVEFLRDRGPDIAGSLTFFGVLSLFPALLAVISLLGVLGQGQRTVDAVMDMLADVAPPAVLDPVRDPIEALVTTPAAGFALVVGVLVALWTASRYIRALGRAINAIFGIEEGRPFWRLLPGGVLLTALLVVLVAIGGLALVFTGPVAETVGGWIGLGDTALAVWSVAQWPGALVSAVLALAILYRFAPNVAGRRFHWISLGAAAALLVIVVATAGFGWVVSQFGSFNRTYGSLAGIIVFLLWLWLVNIGVLYGARLDAEVMRVRQLRAGIPAEEAVRVTPRDTRASDAAARRRSTMLAEYRALRRDPAGGADDAPEAAADDGGADDAPEAAADDGGADDAPEAAADDGGADDAPEAAADDGGAEESAAPTAPPQQLR